MRVLGPCMALAMVLVNGCAQVAAVSGATAAERPTSWRGTMLVRELYDFLISEGAKLERDSGDVTKSNGMQS